MIKKISSISTKEKKQLIIFLKKNHEFKLSSKKYNFLFSPHWTNKKKLGIVLRQKNQIVGFLGLLFADNNLYQNTRVNIINVHTWVVKKKFRNLSLYLLKELNKIDGILINHSSLLKLKEIFLKFGWETLEENFYFFPVNFFTNLSLNYNFKLPGKKKIKNIINEHIKTGSNYICIKVKNEELIIIFNARKKLIFKIAEIVYLSNLRIFNTNIKSISKVLYREFNITFIKVDSRFIDKKNKNNFKNLKFKYKTRLKLFKNNKNINIKKSLINNLYSEFQLIEKFNP